MNNAQTSPANAFDFPLYWTVGFSGKRAIGNETKVAQAIAEAIDFLQTHAQAQGARLSAVSSIARGGDVLFAQTCTTKAVIPWKCLLPFPLDAFLARDLEKERKPDGTELPLLGSERATRLAAAQSCLAAAYSIPPPERPVVNTHNEIRSAYLESGYRTVDEADVMILLLTEVEFEEVLAAARFCELKDYDTDETELHIQGVGKIAQCVMVKSYGPGTKTIARYSIAARRPTILLNAEAPDPWAARKIIHAPKVEKWFFDPVVTEVVREAATLQIEDYPSKEPPGRMTAGRIAARRLGSHLGGLANVHQKKVQSGLRWMLRLHLLASALAALGATVFSLSAEESLSVHLQLLPVYILILAIAAAKPALAFGAWVIEHRLHHHGNRSRWLHARILAETARAAVGMWPLPQQPLDAADEEDFPKLKRLLRTLRVMRELEKDAPVEPGNPLTPDSSPDDAETKAEADMRKACSFYIEGRLKEQADAYFGRQRAVHVARESNYRRLFKVAIWTAILSGVTYLALKLWHGFPYSAIDPTAATPMPWTKITSYLACLAIIAPFVASYALSMVMLLDCRRRSERYGEMQHFLNRLADTLTGCASNPSRLRLIEQAERMLIEEQHEWFSVARNFEV